MTKNHDMSSSLEDYLEAIAEITEDKGHAHTKDIAGRLGVKMPSVTNALQALAARELIRYQSHLPVVLTPEGAELAAKIRHRHESLRAFFSNILKLEDEKADALACKIEHVIRETAMARIVALADAITEREDCAALREYLAEAMPRIGGRSLADQTPLPLDRFPRGGKATVVRIDPELRGAKKFADLGLVPGAVVVMENRAPLGNLLRIKVMGSSLSLRSDDAGHILVKPVEG